MRPHVQHSRRLLLALRTVLATSLSSWQIARHACHNAANQKWSELSSLVHLLRELRPLRVLEIGVSSGGTLSLWATLAHPHAQLAGVDLSISAGARHRIRASLLPSQHLHFVEGDSHASAIRQDITSFFDDTPIDFLFIDGDHSYAGVKEDWDAYAPLVRPGGLVCFHDIVPDYGTRFGATTKHDAGGVHILWDELKARYQYKEFIENHEQNGYGIGVITRAHSMDTDLHI